MPRSFITITVISASVQNLDIAHSAICIIMHVANEIHFVDSEHYIPIYMPGYRIQMAGIAFTIVLTQTHTHAHKVSANTTMVYVDVIILYCIRHIALAYLYVLCIYSQKPDRLLELLLVSWLATLFTGL